jgi:SNF2 family DNA or RNA helicase
VGLSGVLADDMGLGKTLQTLAHILMEKQCGRLDRPVLIVAPTSLIPTWRSEIRKFAPDLRLLVLQGNDRKELFDEIDAHDVVLTSYALLIRDRDELVQRRFRLVVLDEAQAIKNPTTKLARTAVQLQAEQRLALTGTPIENHLGELWSVFNFLIPGLLGDREVFRRVFRNRIEKENDAERQALLVSRVKPFMLRRTKEQVATELPPKTEMLREIELAEGQRDLYETVRLAMHERVRAEIKARGLAQSNIAILEALLKLRQVCCDPRLLKNQRTDEPVPSAKFELLMEMLPNMVETGRKIIVFSQFVEMLDLIDEGLTQQGLPFVKLTGRTRDRETPVKRFQEGEVPIFLISLKAGGVGLTLTAADTVIHYDPWWNPAVEAQATDRAHRIGQNKTVFVYKLIAAGTVEEKMVELQSRKKALYEGVLGGGAAGLSFTEEDIESLFAPLPKT